MNTKTVFIFLGIYLNSFVICEDHTYISNKTSVLLESIKKDQNKEPTISKISHYDFIDYYDEYRNEMNINFNEWDENDDISPYVFDENENLRDYKKQKIESDTCVFKHDSTILPDLFKEFKDINANNTLSFDGKNLKILYFIEELEHLLHDPDYLSEFINLNGVTEIINKTIYNSVSKIRRESLDMLRFCKQNEIFTKYREAETNAIKIALHTLTTDSNIRLKLHAVSILKFLLVGGRVAKANQFFFTNIKGIEELTKIFTTSNNLILQVDILTLIYEILSENAGEQKDDYIFMDVHGNPFFKYTLMTNSWCVLLQKFLFNSTKNNATDSNVITKCLSVMIYLIEDCTKIFHNRELLETLHNLTENYKMYAQDYDAEAVGIMKPVPINVNLYYLIKKLHSAIIGIRTQL